MTFRRRTAALVVQLILRARGVRGGVEVIRRAWGVVHAHARDDIGV